MNKNAFTMIEILAVIVVLGLLVVIITPTVNNLLNDSEDSLYDEQISMVISATKKYMVEHSSLLPDEGNIKVVTIQELIDEGTIDNDSVINPKTKEKLDGCVIVSYNSNFNQYNYEFSSCS